MRCALRVPKSSAIFYDFEDYEQLVDTARRSDWQTYLIGTHPHTRCARPKVLGCETRWDKARRMRDEPHPGSFFFRPPRPSPCPDRRHVARLAAHFLGDEGAVLPFLW